MDLMYREAKQHIEHAATAVTDAEKTFQVVDTANAGLLEIYTCVKSIGIGFETVVQWRDSINHIRSTGEYSDVISSYDSLAGRVNGLRSSMDARQTRSERKDYWTLARAAYNSTIPNPDLVPADKVKWIEERDDVLVGLFAGIDIIDMVVRLGEKRYAQVREWEPTPQDDILFGVLSRVSPETADKVKSGNLNALIGYGDQALGPITAALNIPFIAQDPVLGPAFKQVYEPLLQRYESLKDVHVPSHDMIRGKQPTDVHLGLTGRDQTEE